MSSKQRQRPSKPDPPIQDTESATLARDDTAPALDDMSSLYGPVSMYDWARKVRETPPYRTPEAIPIYWRSLSQPLTTTIRNPSKSGPSETLSLPAPTILPRKPPVETTLETLKALVRDATSMDPETIILPSQPHIAQTSSFDFHSLLQYIYITLLRPVELALFATVSRNISLATALGAGALMGDMIRVRNECFTEFPQAACLVVFEGWGERCQVSGEEVVLAASLPLRVRVLGQGEWVDEVVEGVRVLVRKKMVLIRARGAMGKLVEEQQERLSMGRDTPRQGGCGDGLGGPSLSSAGFANRR